MPLQYLLAFIIGILLSQKINFVYILPFTLLFLLRKYSAYIFFFILGFSISHFKMEIWKNNLKNLDIWNVCGIEGKVVSQPSGLFRKKFILKTEKFIYSDGRRERRKIKIYLSVPKTKIFLGDYIRVEEIKIQRIRGAKNPGGFDFRKYMERDGVFLKGKGKDVIILSHHQGLIPSFLYSVRKRVKNLLEKYFKNMPEERTLIETVSFGRDKVPDFLKDIGIRSGTYHFLVISGFHIGFLYFLIRLLTIPFSLWNNRHPKFFPAFSLIIIWIYALITGLKIPVLRASLMFSFFLLGEIFDREISGFSSIYLACFFLLLKNPFSLYNPSFQLSFTATASLLFMFRYLKRNIGKIPSFIKNYIVGGIAVHISLLPLLVFHFGNYYPLGIINNLIILPFASSTVIFSILFFFLPFIFFFPLKISSLLFFKTAFLLSKFSPSFSPDPLFVLFLYYSIFIILKFKSLIPKILLILPLLSVLIFHNARSDGDKIVFFSSKNPLIFVNDGGQHILFASDADRRREIERIFFPYVKNKKIGEITLLHTCFSFHHHGSVMEILKRYRIKRLYDIPVRKNYFPESNFEIIEIKDGEKIKAGKGTINVLFEGGFGESPIYIYRYGKVEILLIPKIGRHGKKFLERKGIKCEVCYIGGVNGRIKLSRKDIETLYLILQAKYKKFIVFENLCKMETFYLNDSAVIIDFSVPPFKIYKWEGRCYNSRIW
ncbi:MAG: hypothetical protein DRP67_03600 [Candidatus Omnitrophota bacterium]|nr:MAG: hypothetical protein DRP67_03600 [Candidatus Omnitrophota bacterium]